MRAKLWLSIFALSGSTAYGGPSANSLSDPTVYQHHPNSVLALGQGFDPRDTTAAKVPCIKKTGEVRLDPGARKTEYKMFLAEDDYAVDQAMSFDSKISATSLGGPSGSASLGINQSSKYEGSRRRVVIWLYSDYGRFGMQAPIELTSDAAGILADQVAFATKCGTRFVALETRMSWIAVAVEVDSASSLLSSELRGSAGGTTGGASPLSASGEASFKQIANLSAKHKRLQMRVTASGGKGQAQLNSLIESAKASSDVIPALLDGVAKFNVNFGADNAVPVIYSVASFKDAFAPQGSDALPWEDESERALREIAKRYRANEERLAFAIQFRDEPNKSPFRVGINPQQLKAEIEDAQRQQEELKRAWEFCKGGKPQGFSFDGAGQRSEIKPCALPSNSSLLNAFDLSRYPRPTVKYSIAYQDAQGKFKSLPDAAVRSVLTKELANRLASAKAWAPEIGNAFGVGIQFDGSFMLSQTYHFVDNDGGENRISQEGWADALSIWWTSDSAEGMETKLLEHLQKLQPTGSGVVFARITTRFQTYFDVPVFRVNWGAGKAYTEYIFRFDN